MKHSLRPCVYLCNKEAQSIEVVDSLPQSSTSSQPNPEIRPLVNPPCNLSASDSHMHIDRLWKKVEWKLLWGKIGELFKYLTGTWPLESRSIC